MVVANSEVVESVKFPFTQDEILSMISSLDDNAIRMQDCVDFGVRLFDFVFHRKIRDLYRELSASRSDDKANLRITLASSAPELLVLPWELLCDTYPRLLPTFLCHQPNIRLVRSLRLFNRADFKENNLGEKDGSLRILTVSAAPPGVAPIDVEIDERMLKFIIEREPKIGQIRIESCKEATISSLREKIRSFRPHIVHLACHAGYDSKEDLGYVVLWPSEKEQTKRPYEVIHAYRLATLLQESKTIQLVFANTCLGAHQRGSSTFSGVAQCLHALGIPNVVALQFNLFDKTASAIVLNFYQYLLRDGASVEDALSQLRRLMFVDGYMARETFGLTLFQTNTTLSWRDRSATMYDEHSANAERFTSLPEQYEFDLKCQITAEIAKETPIAGWQVKELSLLLDDLPSNYLIKAHETLGFWSIAVLLPGRLPLLLGLPDALLPDSKFLFFLLHTLLDTITYARRLAASRFEAQTFQTAIILMTEADLKAYKDENELGDSTTTTVTHLLDLSIKEALKLSLKIDGQHRAFILVIDPQTRQIRTVIQSLASTSLNQGAAFPQGSTRWAAVQRCVSKNGCALILPGAGRLKLLLNGEQFLAYEWGQWMPADLRELHRKVIKFAEETGLDKDLIIDVFEKCIFASEEPKAIGKAIIIERSDSVLEKAVAGGFNPASGLLRELKEQRITEISAHDFLKGGAGDNAIVISRQGYTLGVNVPLLNAEAIEDEPGTGARHRSAKAVTKKIDAVAVVVSEDRHIVVFAEGKTKLSYLFPLIQQNSTAPPI